MFGYSQFAHYLSFGATDQETSRELREVYTGLVVPGTVAAFQKQGTGGFVLTLSAASSETPYILDPRFPLFQQQLPSPKKSHTALARILGDEDLVAARAPVPGDFSGPRIQSLAECWVRFNETFATTANEKFDKYARRLGEPVDVPNAAGPEYLLAPYFVALSENDEWCDLSGALFDASVRAASTLDVVRVVAVDSATVLSGCLAAAGEERSLIWVSGLNEIEATAAELTIYARAVHDASASGKQTASLYGGFFSVLLGSLGLQGSSHGIGFGESREWRELPQSGPPPARFYVPRVHRYFGQEDADDLFSLDPELGGCDCDICDGQPPLTLDYHDLMKHSVVCRAREIDEWGGMTPQQAADRLDEEHEWATQRLAIISARGPRITPRTYTIADHLLRWSTALRQAE